MPDRGATYRYRHRGIMAKKTNYGINYCTCTCTYQVMYVYYYRI